MKLHTFGCSITQGFALPDVVRAVRDSSGRLLTDQELEAQGIQWSDIHLYQPSDLAWPQVLADRLGCGVVNHARRGSCFQQIARQIAVHSGAIEPGDLVIVMWTYLSRLSLQWPARTAVPLCTIADPQWGWQSVVLGFNRFFGLERRPRVDHSEDQAIQQWIEQSTNQTQMDPMGIFNRYYNNLVLQQIAAQALENTGCRVLHLSVESEPAQAQLERSRRDLYLSLAEPWVIPDPAEWYSVPVDYDCAPVILDPRIPLAENHMHPSVEHHQVFAQWLEQKYFEKS